MTYPEDVLKAAREAAIKVYHDAHKGDVYYDPRRYEARFRSGDCDDDYIVQSACIAIMAEREKVAALVEALREITEGAQTTYRARNGRQCIIEADDGELCLIVHSDLIDNGKQALAPFQQEAK